MRATNSDAASSESGGPNGQVPPPSTVFGEDAEMVIAAGLTPMDIFMVVLPPAALFLIATDLLDYAISVPLFGACFGVAFGSYALVRFKRNVRRFTVEEYHTTLRNRDGQAEASGGENAESGTHSTPTTTKED